MRFVGAWDFPPLKRSTERATDRSPRSKSRCPFIVDVKKPEEMKELLDKGEWPLKYLSYSKRARGLLTS